MMPCMGARPEDAIARFAWCVETLPAVRAAFTTFHRAGNCLTAWALLDDYDEETEARLVEFHSELEASVGNDFQVDVRILYLRGRQPTTLIPNSARVLKSA